MDFGTLRQMVAEDTKGLYGTATITRKIIDAINHHKIQRLWFSEKTFRFNLASGVSTYLPGDGQGLPEGLIEIVGRRLWVLQGGSEQARYPCHRVDTETLEDRKAFSTSSTPTSWDFYGGFLRLDPVPNNSADVLEGRYVSNIGVPLARYTEGAWSFRDPAGGAALADDYTSDWFNNPTAAAMIRHRAVYLLHSETSRDGEAAQTALQLWLEAKIVVEEENEGKEGPVEITPWLLD